MLIVFSSKDSADVLMLEPVARQIVEIMGKDLPSGIVQDASLQEALARLDAAVAEEKQREDQARQQAARQAKRAPDDDEDERARGRPQHKVSLRQRAYPLQTMLREAQAHGHAVTWQAR